MKRDVMSLHQQERQRPFILVSNFLMNEKRENNMIYRKSNTLILAEAFTVIVEFFGRSSQKIGSFMMFSAC